MCLAARQTLKYRSHWVGMSKFMVVHLPVSKVWTELWVWGAVWVQTKSIKDRTTLKWFQTVWLYYQKTKYFILKLKNYCQLSRGVSRSAPVVNCISWKVFQDKDLLPQVSSNIIQLLAIRPCYFILMNTWGKKSLQDQQIVALVARKLL